MNNECQGFHVGATRLRNQPRASRCENKAPCSWRRARRKREAAKGWRVQTTGGRDREICQSISGSSLAAELPRGHYVPSPPAFQGTGTGATPGQTEPGRWRWRASPSDGDEDPPLTPKRPGRGLQDEGWAGAQSQPGAVQVLALLAWNWRPAPVSQDTLLNPLKPAFCLRHPDVPYTLRCLR